MDPLSEVLRSVRLTGGVFLSAHFTAPWCIGVSMTPDDCAPFLRKSAQMIGYHVVIEGELLIAFEGNPMTRVSAGEIVLTPRNDDHTLANEVGIKPVSARDLIQRSPDGIIPRKHSAGLSSASSSYRLLGGEISTQ
jgi:Cupin